MNPITRFEPVASEAWAEELAQLYVDAAQAALPGQRDLWVEQTTLFLLGQYSFYELRNFRLMPPDRCVEMLRVRMEKFCR